MEDKITMTLNSPITEEQWDDITDVDFEHTDRIWFETKHGKRVEFVKVSAQPEQKEPCSTCEGLEDGDTLYASSDWDGGIGFDYIRDIKYCPVCGRRLNNG